MEGIKGERSKQQNHRAENNDQNGAYLGRFEVERINILDLKCFVSMSRIVVPAWAGIHFQKSHEKRWSEDEKWSRKTLDGKCDGYSWGLSGAESRKC